MTYVRPTGNVLLRSVLEPRRVTATRGRRRGRAAKNGAERPRREGSATRSVRRQGARAARPPSRGPATRTRCTRAIPIVRCADRSRVRTSARRAASRRLVVKPASGVSRSGHTAQRARLRTHTGVLFRQRLRVSALPLCGSASASARVRSGLAKAVTACNGVSWIFLASSAEHGGHVMLGPQYAVSARASLGYAARVPGVCAEST